jgi:hypothetical protein
MNNHQNAIFHQLDNFMKHSHSFAMTIFHKITNSAKLDFGFVGFFYGAYSFL